MEQWFNDLEWVESFMYEKPKEFEISDGKLIQRKDVEEVDCSEYETEISGGKAYRCKQRMISDDLYEKLTGYLDGVLDNTLMENQLDMMDAIADLYVAIESR